MNFHLLSVGSLNIQDIDIIRPQFIQVGWQLIFCCFAYPPQQAQDEVFAVGLDEEVDAMLLGALDQQVAEANLDRWMDMQFGLFYGDQRG